MPHRLDFILDYFKLTAPTESLETCEKLRDVFLDLHTVYRDQHKIKLQNPPQPQIYLVKMEPTSLPDPCGVEP